MKKDKLFKIMPVFTVVLIIIVWAIIASIIGVELIFPTPLSALKTLFNLLKSGGFYLALVKTVVRVILCFFISLLLAFLMSMLSLKFKIFEILFYPLIVVVRAVPTMSIIFLCIVWFSSKQTPIIVASAITFPMLYTAILQGVKECDKGLIEMSQLYKVSLKRQILYLYLPSIFNRLFEESVLAIALTVKLIIAAEALSQTSLSIGNLMSVSKANLETAELFAYTVAMVVVSYIIEIIMRLFRKLLRRIEKCLSL